MTAASRAAAPPGAARPWTFHSTPQLIFGRGALERLGEVAIRHRAGKLLIVADQVLAAAGHVGRVQGVLDTAGLTTAVFTGGEPEPSLAAAAAAIEHARRERPDAIVGLGGGSNMDLAKFTAVVATHGGEPADYFGFDRVPGPVMPLICVPTTAGTGSEVSHAAVLTDTENQIKVSCLSQWIRPVSAIVDPALTDSCPPQVTADSGIDALTHAIEAYTAVDHFALAPPEGQASAYEGRHPLGNLLAEEAIRLVAGHLQSAVNSPDPESRDGMALAATLAGMSFSNCGVALVHALEYPLGGALHCSHGRGNGLLLPYVMRFNLPEREDTLARIAALLGEETAGLSPGEAAKAAIAAVERLKRAIGIPERIRQIGGSEGQLAGFADKAYAIERLRWINPRQATRDDLLAIYREAF